jgi:AsmA protein
MKNLIKKTVFITGGIFLIIILALILIPFFVDMGKYKTPLEEKISASIGRSFSIKGDVKLSLFPWAGISFSDLYLGNPEDFKEKDFLRIKEFEARVKLLPLLSKDIQVNKFVLNEPRIMMITQKSGRTNLDGLIPEGESSESPGEKDEKSAAQQGLPIKSLAVGEFTITNGSLTLVDEGQKTRKEITGITLQLNDVSLEKPVKLDFSATIDKLPVDIKGQFGPVGNPPGKKNMPLDLSITALDQIKTSIRGEISNPSDKPGFDLILQTDAFSPGKVLAALGQKDTLKPSDPGVFQTMKFGVKAKGNASEVSLSDGLLSIDGSTLAFKGKVSSFDKPAVSLEARLDAMNLDRYLPKKEAPAKDTGPSTPRESSSGKPDYQALRSLVLDAQFSADDLTVNKAGLKNLKTTITGNKGLFVLDPVSFQTYEGKVDGQARADFKTNTPVFSMNIQANNIQSNPFLKDFMNKDFIEGAVNANLNLRMSGVDSVQIKRSLNGKGELAFKDGAIKGVDLTAMIQNVKTAFGTAAAGGSSGERTDFSELVSPFDISGGVFQTTQTRMVSPLARITVAGTADLNKEVMNFRIEPKFVDTLKGQGDRRDRSGVTVPVLVTGTFSSPKFAPDMNALVQEGIKRALPKVPGLKGLLPGGASEESPESTEEKSPSSLEEGAKGLLKRLPFGR